MDVSKERIRVRSPAKLNLYLEIIGKRPDGYHDLRMLNTAIDLIDTVDVEPADHGIEVMCDDPQVPVGKANLCHRAATAFFKAFPKFRSGLKIQIKKRIPVAGGLGGGSSNAAAVIFALSHLFKASPDCEELVGLASGVGADVPFFLFSSPAGVTGTGEVLEEADPIPDYFFLLARFGFGVSTAWAFSQWDLTIKSSCDSLESRKEGKKTSFSGFWRNDLEAVVISKHPEVKTARDALIGAGAQGAMMTGSGPTVFGVFPDEASAVEAEQQLKGSRGMDIILAKAIKGPIISLDV